MKTYYTAAYINGNPKLARIKVARETEKSVWIDDYENLLGWQSFGSHTSKDKLYLFDSPQAAWDWLAEVARVHVNQLRQDLAKAEKTLAELENARSV